MCYRITGFLLLLASFACFCGARGQTPTPVPTQSPQATPSKTIFGREFKRWFEIESWTLSTRYRYVRTDAGVVTNDQQQWQIQFRPRLKFDSKGKYSIAAFVATGRAFNSGWDNLGPGTGTLQTNLYVKQLYLNAKPTKKVELQFGGIGINQGEGTEITTFDNDGYITGERLIVRAPEQLWFDEISATNAYLGDTQRPNIFGRLHRLDEANYHQFLLRKQATKEVAFSADYTFWAGSDTFHEALRAKPRNFLFTTLLFEAYERVSAPKGYGFDAFAERVINKKFTAGGGFARIDRRLLLNADRFPPGKRLYASLTFKPNKEFSFQPVIVQGVGHIAPATLPRTRIDIILTWNVLETLHRHHIF
jgi:hypothetical protein